MVLIKPATAMLLHCLHQQLLLSIAVADLESISNNAVAG